MFMADDERWFPQEVGVESRRAPEEGRQEAGPQVSTECGLISSWLVLHCWFPKSTSTLMHSLIHPPASFLALQEGVQFSVQQAQLIGQG